MSILDLQTEITDRVFGFAKPKSHDLILKNSIAPDKWRHFYAGILMGIVLQMLARWIYSPPLVHAILFAVAGVIVISYGFELFSKITGHGIYDFMDAVASLIGGLTGMLIVLTILWLFVN